MSNRRKRPKTRRPCGTYCPACHQRVYQVLCPDGQVRYITHRGELRCWRAFGRGPDQFRLAS
jgi:hypothetical protein